MMGISVGYAPIFPLAHTPILVLVGAVEDRPVVDAGAVVPGKVLMLTGSFDHRFIDGFHAARFAGELKGVLEAPEGLEQP
jgi:pyruvate dehydrogenase E2 component (dihydrolipoamide acetyltransferase)